MKKLILAILLILAFSAACLAQSRGTRVTQPPPQWTVGADGSVVLVDSTKPIGVKTTRSGTSNYYDATTDVHLDLSAASTHIIELKGATVTTGVSVYVINQATTTNQAERQTVIFKQGDIPNQIVWTFAVATESGVTQQPASVPHSRSYYVMEMGADSGTTIVVLAGTPGVTGAD